MVLNEGEISDLVFDLNEEMEKYHLPKYDEGINELLDSVLASYEQQFGSTDPASFSPKSQKQWENILRKAGPSTSYYETYCNERRHHPKALFLALSVLGKTARAACVPKDQADRLYYAADMLSSIDGIYGDWLEVHSMERTTFGAQETPPTAESLKLKDISKDDFERQVKSMYKEIWDRDQSLKDMAKHIEVPQPVEVPQETLDLKFDRKARIRSEELAKVMDESFAKAIQTTVRNINQSTVLWTTVGELNPGGFQAEDKMNSQLNDWRAYLYEKKKNGDLNKLAAQIGDLMGDPRVYESLARYKIDNAKTLKDKYPSKNSLRIMARSTTSQSFISTVENFTERTERGARKYTDLAFFKVNAGGSGTDWVVSVFIRLIVLADVLVYEGVFAAYTGMPLTLVLGAVTVFSYLATILMKITNTQFFDFTLAVIGKLPKMPTATVLVHALEALMDKLYPHMKPFYPAVRLLLKYTQPIWNSMMSYIMSIVTQGSQKLVDFLRPSEYSHVRTTESINAILLRFIRLYLYISRSIEEGIIIYVTLVMKLLWGIIKWLGGKLFSLIK